MQCDNQAAIKALENGRGSFKHCKHILKRFFYISDLVTNGKIALQWISGELMPADLLTKAVVLEVLLRLFHLLQGQSARATR